MIRLSINVRELAVDEIGNCVEIVYDETELLVTLDFGPRIVSAKKGGENLIFNGPDSALGRSCGHKMRITLDKSTNGIYCDNSPVRYSLLPDGVSFEQSIIDPVQLEVFMDIYFTENGELTVEHRVHNKSKEELKLSIYTETPFVTDGFVFVPQSEIVNPERPTNILTLWEGCKWSDKRLFIGDKYVTVRTAPAQGCPERLKIGVNDTDGLAGFVSPGGMITKSFTHNTSALYPFYNCSAFATAEEECLTIQMTSPFFLVEPDEAARHLEVWSISDSGSDAAFDDEKAIGGIFENN